MTKLGRYRRRHRPTLYVVDGTYSARCKCGWSFPAHPALRPVGAARPDLEAVTLAAQRHRDIGPDDYRGADHE
jgi:hypothetical protein